MRRPICILLLAVAFAWGAGKAEARPPELRDLVDAPNPAGCSEYSFMFWDFYRAELWTDDPDLPGKKFGLSLTYLSDFSRDALVKSTIDEMVRISGQPEASFAKARIKMQQIFRDVEPGDRITAWRAGAEKLRLFVNGEETGTLNREVDLFLAIWLSEETRHPEGRQALLSGRCDG
ncbi:MAG: hypothetical protein OEN23_20015 [Paracoccaceae bacterium]|nr:hypothetical protein [Paracoccaceae bacterium]